MSIFTNTINLINEPEVLEISLFLDQKNAANRKKAMIVKGN